MSKLDTNVKAKQITVFTIWQIGRSKQDSDYRCSHYIFKNEPDAEKKLNEIKPISRYSYGPFFQLRKEEAYITSGGQIFFVDGVHKFAEP